MENTSEKVLKPIPPYTVLTNTLCEMKQQLDVIKSIAVFQFHELIPYVLKLEAQTEDFIHLVNNQTDKTAHQEEKIKVIKEEVINIEEEVEAKVESEVEEHEIENEVEVVVSQDIENENKEVEKEETTELLGENLEEEQQFFLSSRPTKKSKVSRNIVIKVSNHQYVPKVLHPHMIVTYKVDT